MTLQLREGLLAEAFSTLRTHGAGERECVVYLTGSLDSNGIVDELLHPDHIARPDFYEVDQAWLHQTSLQLARRRRQIRIQIHTHQFAASHSQTDDNFPAVGTPGFLSLVLPNFATGPIGLHDAFLVALDDDGSWLELDPLSELIAS